MASPDARDSTKGHEAPTYVAPSHYLRPRTGIPDRSSPNSRATQPMSQGDIEQHEALRAIRAFLKVRRSYDVLPLSYRLIVFDTALLVKKSLNILIQNGMSLE